MWRIKKVLKPKTFSRDGVNDEEVTYDSSSDEEDTADAPKNEMCKEALAKSTRSKEYLLNLKKFWILIKVAEVNDANIVTLHSEKATEHREGALETKTNEMRMYQKRVFA